MFKAELNEFLTRELAEDGYSGVEVRVTPTRTEIIIMATKTQNVLGEKGRRIRELTAVVQKRLVSFPCIYYMKKFEQPSQLILVCVHICFTDSTSLKGPLNCMPKKLRRAVYALSPKPNHFATN